MPVKHFAILSAIGLFIGWAAQGPGSAGCLFCSLVLWGIAIIIFAAIKAYKRYRMQKGFEQFIRDARGRDLK